MTNKTDYLYVGCDVHKNRHTAVLLTYMEENIGHITIENNIRGFKRLYDYIEKRKKNLIPVFGLEDVTHFGRDFTIYLLNQGYPVKEVNSALSHAERMSYATTKKSDDWDARCISVVLMRRYATLPDADPKDFFWTMRHLVNRRDALVRSKTALVNQFHDQIHKNYPSYRKFFHEIECSTSLAFYEAYPSAGMLEGVEIEELAELLREHSHNSCSTKRAEKIVGITEADNLKERDYQFGRDVVIQSIVRNIRFNLEEIKKVEEVEERMLKELGYQLETIPGINTVTACALVAYIGDVHRFANADKLASYAGIAPICFSSAGKGKNMQNKNQGSRELYAIFYFLAIQQIYQTKEGIPRNPLLHAYFEYKVSKGKTKIQGLICIMRRLVTIIYAMMVHQSAYQLPEVVEEEMPQEGCLTS